MINKIQNGVFYTIKNCFNNKVFLKWLNDIPNINKQRFIEPFCGQNNIIKMIKDLNYTNNWIAFDINKPSVNYCPDVIIQINDSINNYNGKLNDIVITNPPYLAKNSAKRKGIIYNDNTYDDIYKVCLNILLSTHNYVVAIIPESFITSKLFLNRLDLIISIPEIIFNDTEVPCCIACFGKNKQDICYDVYSQENHLLNINSNVLEKINNIPKNNLEIKFNSLLGQISCICIDNTNTASIEFKKGDYVKDKDIKISSRSKTRIYIKQLENKSEEYIDKLINKLNFLIFQYREETKDVFLTSFKGLRKDGKYRRRIDFKTIKKIIIKGIEEC